MEKESKETKRALAHARPAAGKLESAYESIDWQPIPPDRLAEFVRLSHAVRNCLLDEALGDAATFSFRGYTYYWLPERGVYEWYPTCAILKLGGRSG